MSASSSSLSCQVRSRLGMDCKDRYHSGVPKNQADIGTVGGVNKPHPRLDPAGGPMAWLGSRRPSRKDLADSTRGDTCGCCGVDALLIALDRVLANADELGIEGRLSGQGYRIDHRRDLRWVVHHHQDPARPRQVSVTRSRPPSGRKSRGRRGCDAL